MCAVRVSETLSRSPKRNRSDECIVIILTIAARITSIHSILSTVNWYHMVAWFPFDISQPLAFRFQLTVECIFFVQFNQTERFNSSFIWLCCCCPLLLFRIYLSFLVKCDAVGEFFVIRQQRWLGNIFSSLSLIFLALRCLLMFIKYFTFERSCKNVTCLR